MQFTTIAHKTYIIQADDTGPDANLQIFLYNRCEAPPLASDDNAFGHAARIVWNAEEASTYSVKLRNHDPDVYGSSTAYRLSVSLDTTPPSRPQQVRISPGDRMLAVQWQMVPDEDVTGYYVDYQADTGESGYAIAQGRATTYAELTGLRNNVRHCVWVTAFDFSGNEGPASRQVCTNPAPPADNTVPAIRITGPTQEAVYTTTMESLNIQGEVSDVGGNLSRVLVRNQANNSQGWDYGLSGSEGSFSVLGVQLEVGENPLVATVYDSIGNASSALLTVYRLSGGSGAAVIVAGRRLPWDETQLNIYYATNHAYRVFRRAGFEDDHIHYLAHDPQDVDGDGEDDVDLKATRANLEMVLTEWVVGQVGPGRPLWLYLMDHGDVDEFCIDDCVEGSVVRPQDLAGWLAQLERTTGMDEVNVIYEACHSGSFLEQPGLVSGSGRMVIASTASDQFAYAVQGAGAYFSDAFFSVLGSGGSLLAGFQAGEAAARAAWGWQEPWMDGDGDGEVNEESDRTVADARYLFPAVLGPGRRPAIERAGVSGVVGGTGTLWVQVRWGEVVGRQVWASIFSPSYEPPPPDGITLPEDEADRVLLEDEDGDGVYEGEYSGFLEKGEYRVVLYAMNADRDQAEPKELSVWVGAHERLYVPVVYESANRRSIANSKQGGQECKEQ